MPESILYLDESGEVCSVTVNNAHKHFQEAHAKLCDAIRNSGFMPGAEHEKREFLIRKAANGAIFHTIVAAAEINLIKDGRSFG